MVFEHARKYTIRCNNIGLTSISHRLTVYFRHIKNFKECVEGGLSEESLKRYRNAIELYYKAVVALCDIIIFDKEGDIPDYHKKRNDLLEQLNGDINKIRIGLHTLYRQSYYKTDFTIQDTREIKNAIKTIVLLKKPGKEVEELIKKI